MQKWNSMETFFMGKYLYFDHQARKWLAALVDLRKEKILVRTLMLPPVKEA